MPVGNVGKSLPKHFLLPPAPDGQRVLRLTFQKDESIAFFADASFSSPPQTTQDLEMLGVFGVDFLWRLFSGSPLPANAIDFAIFSATATDPIGLVKLGVAVYQKDILGVIQAIEKMRRDPIIAAQLTTLGIPISKFSAVGTVARVSSILEFFTFEFIAALSFPNDTLTIKAN